jgi:hypothetical protein
MDRSGSNKADLFVEMAASPVYGDILGRLIDESSSEDSCRVEAAFLVLGRDSEYKGLEGCFEFVDEAMVDLDYQNRKSFLCLKGKTRPREQRDRGGLYPYKEGRDQTTKVDRLCAHTYSEPRGGAVRLKSRRKDAVRASPAIRDTYVSENRDMHDIEANRGIARVSRYTPLSHLCDVGYIARGKVMRVEKIGQRATG